MEKKQFENGKV